jgi:multidrug efflux pump subunit AcrB
VLVVVVFLRNAWGTLIAGLSIPASLLIGLAAMHVLGFSVNTLTMLALILAIGIVVDDAIVILESSYRHLEQGAASIPAARVGTTEVAFAALANTAALGAVFIPVAFTAGLIGRFFFEFGITVAATIFASTFTALTLTPMLSSRLLRAPSGHGLLYRTSQRAYNALEGAYAKLLNLAMAHRLATILVALAALVGAGLAARGLSTEFMPAVDRGQFLISFEMPEGATLWRTDAYARKLERVLDETPEVEQFFLAIGLSRGAGPGKVNTGVSFVRLIDRSRRGRGQLEIMQELRRRFAKIPDGQAFVIEMSAIGQAGAELQLVLQNPDIDALAARQDEVMAWMRGRSEFVGVNTNLKMNKPEVEVSILRDKARSLGVAALSISDTMRLVLGEPDISEIERRAERYEIIPEVAWKGRMVPEDIGQLYVRADGGDLVSLENVTEQVEATGPSEIHHYNRIRSAQISSSTPPGVPLGKAVGALSDHLDRTLPTGFQYTYAGQSQEFQDAFANLSVTIVFSIAFVFLALSAQFESFLHPLAIFVTLPLAAVGAFGALWIGGLSLGVFAYIGLIMLMGMATKNGILMIDYSNVLVARGQEVHDAARQAARVRFRPVVMTTVSTVLGIMPIALGYGAGGTARRPMGVAVAVGLTTTTLLTLVVLPVVYTLIQDTHGWVSRQVGRRQRDAKAGR